MKMLPRLATLCILLLALSAYMNAGDVLNDFTFYLTGPSTSIETFHAEIYAWNGNLLGGNPLQGALGAPLFSTGPIVYTGTAALTPITINTGGLALANGAYVALFTVSSLRTTPTQMDRSLSATSCSSMLLAMVGAASTSTTTKTSTATSAPRRGTTSPISVIWLGRPTSLPG